MIEPRQSAKACVTTIKTIKELVKNEGLEISDETALLWAIYQKQDEDTSAILKKLSDIAEKAGRLLLAK